MLILKRERFKRKFDNMGVDNKLEWLADVRTPTAAIAIAYQKLSDIENTAPCDVRDDFIFQDEPNPICQMLAVGVKNTQQPSSLRQSSTVRKEQCFKIEV